MEFGNGLNILTGEIGAGKSIIIGSVALALGAKASRDMIRCGKSKVDGAVFRWMTRKTGRIKENGCIRMKMVF